MLQDFFNNPDLTSPIFYWQFFVNQFQTNQLFTGLLVLSILSTLVFTLRGIPAQIFQFLKGQLTVELKVQNEDDFYDNLKLYLSQTNYVKNRCRRLTLDTNYDSETDTDVPSCGSVSRYGRVRNIFGGNKPTGDVESAKELPSFTLTPMDGSHWFFYKRNIIFYTRTIDEEKGDMRKETIVLRYLGRNRKLIYQLIADMDKFNNDDKNTIRVLGGGGQYWQGLGEKMKRSLDTVYIPEADKKFLVDDMNWFYDNAEWYRQRGIPYHRGYLFSGPPGTGKTSIIKAICSERDMKMAICNLSVIKDDRELMDLMADTPKNCIVIIEDIDACMATKVRVKKKGKEEKTDGVTLSGLLNALDGITTPENQVFILTTNHPENLDPALLRKGRVDVQMEFGNMEADMVKAMFLAFFPAQKRHAKKISEALTADGPIAPAKVQGIFFEYAKDPKGIVKKYLKK